ncbi:MAG TPA: hypothetical protein VJ505_01285 [Holophagaceae bacterium]|nr:hypothetical protein [Holophagaceae bacterium]
MTPLPESAPQAAAQPIPFAPPAGRPEYYRDPRLKSPVIATVLSGMPGLGLVYLGYTQLAFIHAVAAAGFVALMSSNKLGPLEPFVGVSMAFFFLYNLVDAHRRAQLINESLTRMEAAPLPDGFGTVSFGGRLAFGVGLILVGILSLLHLRFGISMAWLADWWPVGLVLLGLYLVGRAVKDRAAHQEPQQD